MAYSFVSNYVGLQPIATTSTTQNHNLGTVARAYDPTYGEGTFIYMKGVVSAAVADVVTYSIWIATRWAGTAYSGAPVAIAMSANVAANWGWYQVAGLAVVTTSSTVAAGDAANYSTTATVKTAAVTGKQIINMIATAANGTPATNQTVYQIAYPTVQGTIT